VLTFSIVTVKRVMDIEGAEEIYFFSYAEIFARTASFWLLFRARATG